MRSTVKVTLVPSFLKAALIVDVRNIYGQVRRSFPGRVLAYDPFVKKLEETYGLRFVQKVAFVMQHPAESEGFNNYLRQNRFEVHCANVAWNVEIALKAASILPTVDALVMASSYNEHGRILRYAKEMGKFTFAAGTAFPENFRNVAELFYIDASMTKPRSENGKQLELSPESRGTLADGIPAETDS